MPENNQQMDATTLEGAVRLHQKYLAHQEDGRRLILRFASLEGIDLSGTNLKLADLTGTNFKGAKLSRCNFTEADLQGVDFTKCDLRAAILKKANLRGAELSEADLSFADMSEADCREGNLAVQSVENGIKTFRHKKQAANAYGANFTGARLDYTRMTGANASAACFRDCSMRDIRLDSAKVKDSDFTGANLENADLQGSDFEGAIFHDAILSKVRFGAKMPPEEAMQGAIIGPDLSDKASINKIQELVMAHKEWWRTNGESGKHANLEGLDLRAMPNLFSDGLLTALVAKNVQASGMSFSGSQLQGANFEGADLRGAIFTNADLRGANFKNAKLNNARFDKANLGQLYIKAELYKPSDFTGAIMRFVNFNESDVSNAIFYDVDMTGSTFVNAKTSGVKRGKAP